MVMGKKSKYYHTTIDFPMGSVWVIQVASNYNLDTWDIVKGS